MKIVAFDRIGVVIEEALALVLLLFMCGMPLYSAHAGRRNSKEFEQYRKLFGEYPDPKLMPDVRKGLTDEEVAEIKRRQEGELSSDGLSDNSLNEDNLDVRDFGFTGYETKDPDMLDPRGIAFDEEVIKRAKKKFPGFPDVEAPKSFDWTYEGGKAALRRQVLRVRIRQERQRELESWERMVVKVAEGNATNEVVEFFWTYESKSLADVKRILKGGKIDEARNTYRKLQDRVKVYDGDAERIISHAEAGPASVELSRRTRAVIEGVPDCKTIIRTKAGKVALDRYLLEGASASEYHSRVRISIGATPGGQPRTAEP